MSSRDCQRMLDLLFGNVDDEVIYTGTKQGHIEGLLRGRDVARSAKALYTNHCTFGAPGEDGLLARTDANVEWMYFITLDDIVEKCPIPELAPTVVVETSPGSFQYMYALTEPITLEEGKEFMERLKLRTPALGDLASMTANRLIKIPGGINDKQGAKHGFKTRLVSDSDKMYSIEELAETWSLPAYTPRSRTNGSAVGDFTGVTDEVVAWLSERGMLIDQEVPFHTVLCPWSELHTDGVLTAGYSPLGVGTMPNVRGFSCFHEHCLDKKGPQFLEWVAGEGGPSVGATDPVAPLVQRYVLLEYSSEVADTWAAADAVYPVVSLSAFRAAHREYVMGERGGKQYHGELWLENAGTTRCKGRVYKPGESMVADIRGVPHFNTYRPMVHDAGVGSAQVYLSHVQWLIPDPGERWCFHAWVAAKVQDPASRSWAMVLVADLAEGEAGNKYGTGRSMMGDILERMFQSGVARIELSDLTGQGDSQAAYNDWADGTQLVIIEETKSDVGDWRADHASYERLKGVIDPKPQLGVRVKPKYGKIYTTTLYCNFLFFTNHSDALQLPAGEDERRFGVMDCAKGRRGVAEYAALYGFLNDPDAIAALYWWYKSFDVSEFDRIYPPMTPAKALMQRQSKSTVDEVWEAALLTLPGDIVTKAQLRDACAMVQDVDGKLEQAVMGMVSARWKKMADIAPGWRLPFGEQKLSCRILRNHDDVRKTHREGGLDSLREMISHNGR